MRRVWIVAVVLAIAIGGCVEGPGTSAARADPALRSSGDGPSALDPQVNGTAEGPRNGTGTVVFTGCRGSIPSLPWPREIFPWPAPIGMENDFPTPEIRMFAFACDSMDALGLETFTNVSIAILAHSNTSRAEEIQETPYDAALVALDYFADPLDARRFLADHGIINATEGVVHVYPDPESPEVDLATESGGAVELSLNRRLAGEAPNARLGPRTWLVLPAVRGDVPVTVRYEGLIDGYGLPGTWAAQGDVAYADWVVMTGPGAPAKGSYLHDTTLTLTIAA